MFAVVDVVLYLKKSTTVPATNQHAALLSVGSALVALLRYYCRHARQVLVKDGEQGH